MALQAVLIGFTGVVVEDELLHQEALNRLLVEENLRPLQFRSQAEYRQQFGGRGDVERIRLIWGAQGRILTPQALTPLLRRKQSHYLEALAALPKLPLVPYVVEMLERIRQLDLRLGLVTNLAGQQVRELLDRCQLTDTFSVILTGDNLPQEPLAESALGSEALYRQALTHWNLPPTDCLGIESSYIGIQAGQAAGIEMVGVATVAPLHMIGRRADWAVDRLAQIEWERLVKWFSTRDSRPDPVL